MDCAPQIKSLHRRVTLLHGQPPPDRAPTTVKVGVSASGREKESSSDEPTHSRGQLFNPDYQRRGKASSLHRFHVALSCFAAKMSMPGVDPSLALHQQQVATAANAMQQAVMPQQQQQHQQTPGGTPHQGHPGQGQVHGPGPGRPPNADRHVTVDGRRFQRLEDNVARLLELTQLMMNRQEELNDRMVQREQHLQNQVSFTAERLQLAMQDPNPHHPGGGIGIGMGGVGVGPSGVGGRPIHNDDGDGDDDDDDDDEDDEDDGPPPDMAYPPLGMQFRPNFGAKKPLEGLLDNINLWAKEHGYKCATLRSTQKPGERVRVAIRCALGGEARYKVTDENGEALIRTKSGQLRKPYRKRTSKKTGCEFGFILGETGQGTNIFEVRYHPNGSPPHNHPPMDF